MASIGLGDFARNRSSQARASPQNGRKQAISIEERRRRAEASRVTEPGFPNMLPPLQQGSLPFHSNGINSSAVERRDVQMAFPGNANGVASFETEYDGSDSTGNDVLKPENDYESAQMFNVPLHPRRVPIHETLSGPQGLAPNQPDEDDANDETQSDDSGYDQDNQIDSRDVHLYENQNSILDHAAHNMHMAQQASNRKAHSMWDDSEGSYPTTTAGLPSNEWQPTQKEIAPFQSHNTTHSPNAEVAHPDYKTNMVRDLNRQHMVRQLEPGRAARQTHLPVAHYPQRPISEYQTAQNSNPHFDKGRREGNAHVSATALPAIGPNRPIGDIEAKQVTLEELDYDISSLQKLDFSALQQESFDEDPHRDTSSNNAPASTEADFGERLRHVLHLSQDEQQRFMTSLSLSEWEDAGAWFTDEFRKLMEKMTKSRQARREHAQAFEAEVCKRHEAVSRERQNISDLFVKMKASGGNVLREGTPKRKRG